MTIDYIEIIRRSPYYYQVDGALLEDKCPCNIGVDFIWGKWKKELPDYCKKEKVFLNWEARRKQEKSA